MGVNAVRDKTNMTGRSWHWTGPCQGMRGSFGSVVGSQHVELMENTTWNFALLLNSIKVFQRPRSSQLGFFFFSSCGRQIPAQCSVPQFSSYCGRVSIVFDVCGDVAAQTWQIILKTWSCS